MKNMGIMILLTLLFTQIELCNEIQAKIQDPERIGKQNDGNKEVIIGRNFLKISENDSSVNIRFRNRGLTILESLEEGQEIKLEKYNEQQDWNNEQQNWNNEQQDWNNNDNNNRHESKRNRFKGNWSGIEFGFNNYTTSGENIVIPEEINYMTLHSGKSHNFNLNFAQLNLGLSRHIGFVTGLGLNWNNYRFDGNNNIIKGVDGVIESYDPGAELQRSKLSTIYLTVPFLFEVQVPVNNSHLNLAAGPIGAVKLASHSKMVFEDNRKIKSNSDFNLNILRYGATGRVGFSNFQLYGTYYMTPLFQTGKGPLGYNLYPFEVGIALTFND